MRPPEASAIRDTVFPRAAVPLWGIDSVLGDVLTTGANKDEGPVSIHFSWKLHNADQMQ